MDYNSFIFDWICSTFENSNGNLNSIKFDEKMATLYLPKVKLDNNTEVILRNMVAFEASAALGAMVFT